MHAGSVLLNGLGCLLQGIMSDYAPLERPMIPAIVVSRGLHVNRVMWRHSNFGGPNFVHNVNFTCLWGHNFMWSHLFFISNYTYKTILG